MEPQNESVAEAVAQVDTTTADTAAIDTTAAETTVADGTAGAVASEDVAA